MRLLLALFLAAVPAQARKSSHAPRKPAKAVKAAPAARLEPSRWFASRPGLLRVYQGHGGAANAESDEPPPGASCEVLESKPRDSLAAGSLKESCTMIVQRQARPATELTYELRQDGIFNVEAKPAGGKAVQFERLVLPGPIKVGAAWKEPRGNGELDRSVKTAGGACRAAGRSFADCLVLAVTQKEGKKVVRKYTETYAAGVGLVEDAQWELVDVKGL